MTKKLAGNILAFFFMLPKNYPSNNVLNPKKFIKVFQIITLRYSMFHILFITQKKKESESKHLTKQT